MNNEHSPAESNLDAYHGTFVMYAIGFVLSILFTFVAFYFVNAHVLSEHVAFSHQFLLVATTGLGIAQLLVQLICFLHLGNKSTSAWNLLAIAFATLLVSILVIGSFWIMYNLNTNMQVHGMQDMLQYMVDQSG
jgi:cytochrome o ubiquinol oxidase operon protein cyoD